MSNHNIFDAKIDIMHKLFCLSPTQEIELDIQIVGFCFCLRNYIVWALIGRVSRHFQSVPTMYIFKEKF